ncbi:MAG TPA: hypothetical protein PK156_28395 [Polyangium sp.]|nr:hypothetical protein [Polyangium sp.]
MIRQLSLFGDDSEDKPVDVVVAPQLDLFNQRVVGLGQVSELLRCGELAEAHRALKVLQSKLPRDPIVAEHARIISDLRHRHGALMALSPKDRAPAMLRLAREFLNATGNIHEFAQALGRRATHEWCITCGDDKLLDGRLPGEWFVSGGALEDAVHSFERAAVVRYDARLAFHWADALTAMGRTAEARCRYRDAFLRDPFHDAAQNLRDDVVRSLPEIARYEIGIEEEPLAWAAPVGMVVGVLPRPTDATLEYEGAECTCTSTQREALQRARKFAVLLMKISQSNARKDADLQIELRREMKNSCPELFQVLLRRRT